MTVHYLNAKRLLCPIPVIRTQNAIKELVNGDVLEVTCTDPGVLADIPAWCRIHGHTVVKQQQQDEEIVITIAVNKEPTDVS